MTCGLPNRRLRIGKGGCNRRRSIPRSTAWDRHRLHNAANVYHVQRDLGLTPEDGRTYRVAWVGGCVLYDRNKLEGVGGFSFWNRLPPNHAGEEIVVQLQLMSRFGGCGVLPSGVYHQELPTTVPDRTYDAPTVILGKGVLQEKASTGRAFDREGAGSRVSMDDRGRKRLLTKPKGAYVYPRNKCSLP